MDYLPQNLQDTLTIEIAEDPTSFMIYWGSCLGYLIIIKLMMEYAFSQEFVPVLKSSADAEALLRAVLQFGYKFSLTPTLSPVITWSILSYVLPFLFNFLMGFWGGWSLVGVYFFNLIFSYSDDIIISAVVSSLQTYITTDVTNVSMYDIFPSYLTSFIIKTLANIGMVYVAVTYYGGWKDHRIFKIEERKAAAAEAASPFAIAM